MARPNLRRRDALAAVSLLMAVIAGCTGKDPTRPGESIGIFSVEAKLVSSTCGATPNPWKFDVRLRHDGAILYWVQGDAPISAQVDAAAHAVLKSSVTSQMRAADAKTQTAACNMSRTDVVDLVLAPVATPGTEVGAATSFKGTLGYSFAATDGSACTDQLSDYGGDFAAIPCTVSYELVGTRTGDAK